MPTQIIIFNYRETCVYGEIGKKSEEFILSCSSPAEQIEIYLKVDGKNCSFEKQIVKNEIMISTTEKLTKASNF